MTALVPAPSPALQLELLLQAHATQAPVPLLTYRHVAIHEHAQVLSVLGLTGENVPVGFALGALGADTPHTVIIVGDPRDPALAVRAGARLADLLTPLLATHIGGGEPVQILVDGPNSLTFLHAMTFRTRSPWLPGPYAADPQLLADADRCRDAHALVRALLSAATVPGADVVLDAVTALTAHLVFPLGGAAEQQQLPVLLACLRHAGAPVIVPGLPQVPGDLLAQIEAAEAVTVSAAADPAWDNAILVPALSSFKRLRNRACGGDQLRRVEPALVTQAAMTSGLAAHVTAQLVLRHAATAQAFRVLALLPALPSLPARAARAARRVTFDLNRGARGDRGWRDFPSLITAARSSEDDQRLIADALLEAARDDTRVFSLAQARGEAVTTRVVRRSADGRTVDLELTGPLTPRKADGWWWLDDTHAPPRHRPARPGAQQHRTAACAATRHCADVSAGS